MSQQAPPLLDYFTSCITVLSRPGCTPPESVYAKLVLADAISRGSAPEIEEAIRMVKDCYPSNMVVAEVLVLAAGILRQLRPTPPAAATTFRQHGRPHDPEKQRIVEYVRELREGGTLWKAIPALVSEKFGKYYTAETLRGYLKSG